MKVHSRLGEMIADVPSRETFQRYTPFSSLTIPVSVLIITSGHVYESAVSRGASLNSTAVSDLDGKPLPSNTCWRGLCICLPGSLEALVLILSTE